MKDPAYEAGLAVRRRILGDAHVNRSLENATTFDEDFQDLVTRLRGAPHPRAGAPRESGPARCRGAGRRTGRRYRWGRSAYRPMFAAI